MSRVTNLLLASIPGDIDRNIAAINEWLRRGDYGDLVAADDGRFPRHWYGGTKMLEVDLYIGAFNYFDLDAFAAMLRRLAWDFPEDVDLIVKEQDDAGFRVVKPLAREG